jgi:hypothetical protein
MLKARTIPQYDFFDRDMRRQPGLKSPKQGIAHPGSILNLENKFALGQMSAGQRTPGTIGQDTRYHEFLRALRSHSFP